MLSKESKIPLMTGWNINPRPFQLGGHEIDAQTHIVRMSESWGKLIMILDFIKKVLFFL